MVHYVSRGSADMVYLPECRAATITEVHDDETVSLCVMNPNGLYFTSQVPYDGEYHHGGTWHWPERA